MQLTRFTDFGLRVLMYLCTPAPQQREQAVSVAEFADRFVVARHQLNKVVQFLAQLGWVVTTRARGTSTQLVGFAAYKAGII